MVILRGRTSQRMKVAWLPRNWSADFSVLPRQVATHQPDGASRSWLRFISNCVEANEDTATRSGVRRLIAGHSFVYISHLVVTEHCACVVHLSHTCTLVKHLWIPVKAMWEQCSRQVKLPVVNNTPATVGVVRGHTRATRCVLRTIVQLNFEHLHNTFIARITHP